MLCGIPGGFLELPAHVCTVDAADKACVLTQDGSTCTDLSHHDCSVNVGIKQGCPAAASPLQGVSQFWPLS